MIYLQIFTRKTILNLDFLSSLGEINLILSWFSLAFVEMA